MKGEQGCHAGFPVIWDSSFWCSSYWLQGTWQVVLVWGWMTNKYRSARESQVPGAKAVAYFCHELRTPMFYVERNTFKAPDHSCTDLENEEQVLLLSTPKHPHRMAVAVSTPTFCMLRRSSDVLMLPSANLNLSRFITDSSPAFALIGGTLSP